MYLYTVIIAYMGSICVIQTPKLGMLCTQQVIGRHIIMVNFVGMHFTLIASFRNALLQNFKASDKHFTNEGIMG